MAAVFVLPVMRPFLKLVVAAGLQRQEPRSGLLYFCPESGIAAKHGLRFQAVGEQLPDERNIHGRSCADRSRPLRRAEFMLRRGGWRGNQPSLPVVLQPTKGEARRFLHNGISEAAKIVFIPAEGVMLPQMLGQPDAAHRPECPGRIAFPVMAGRGRMPPDVGIVMSRPAAGPVVYGSSPRAVLREPADQRQQRLMAFSQVADLRRPVVHLGIDVKGIIAAPRRPGGGIPDALQVGRLCARPGAGNEKVTSVLEQQLGQSGVLRPPFRDAPVGGQLLSGLHCAELQLHPAE
ncbi:hypothetical protein D3C75_742160 [compost metagenome]